MLATKRQVLEQAISAAEELEVLRMGLFVIDQPTRDEILSEARKLTQDASSHPVMQDAACLVIKLLDT